MNRDLRCGYDNLPEGPGFSEEKGAIDRRAHNDVLAGAHRNVQVHSAKLCLCFRSAQAWVR
jgi:hypothetical protein